MNHDPHMNTHLAWPQRKVSRLVVLAFFLCIIPLMVGAKAAAPAAGVRYPAITVYVGSG